MEKREPFTVSLCEADARNSENCFYEENKFFFKRAPKLVENKVAKSLNFNYHIKRKKKNTERDKKP